MTDAQPKKSDLGVRVVSAVVMVVAAAAALWLGGWVWRLFVMAVAGGVLWEWWGLVRGFGVGTLGRALWLAGGFVYVGLAAMMIALLREDALVGWALLLVVMLGVIGTDIGAYFAGRAIGGPKIAPSISPSKTWAGLGGGILGATGGILLALRIYTSAAFAAAVNRGNGADVVLFSCSNLASALLGGAVIAIVAQSGDFFESWMKRRAGVKDSGSLIPGHGGLFDRADGLIAVLFAIGLFALGTIAITLASGGSLLPSPQ